MTMQLSKSAYEKLIQENLAWLLAQPRTLERDHIEQIVRHSVVMHYPAKEPVSVDGAFENDPDDHAFVITWDKPLPFKPGDRVRVVKIEEIK